MNAGCQLDIDAAVRSFVKNFQKLSRGPMVTDIEMFWLFGSQVAEALADLDNYNQQEGICRDCINRCCMLVRCELYDANLNLCPVQSFRPVLCRMHFCDKFAQVHGQRIKEIGDIFLESLLEARLLDYRLSELFDCPPLGRVAPGLINIISPLIILLRDGKIARDLVVEAIQSAVEKYDFTKFST